MGGRFIIDNRSGPVAGETCYRGARGVNLPGQSSVIVDTATGVDPKQIQELIEESSWPSWGTRSWEANDLANEAERYLGDDPALAELRARIARPVNITSDPPGAEVWAKAYADVDGPFRLIGTTPLKEQMFPKGVSRVRLDADGHESVLSLGVIAMFFPTDWWFRLPTTSSVPEGMAFVTGGNIPFVLIVGLDHLKPDPTADFYVDRYEVTRGQYKQFIDAGGYQNADYWKEPFVEDGETLIRTQAMDRFRDTTGRHGPAEWIAGDQRPSLA